MYNPNDPRFRRTLNNVSQRLEVANETAQISLFSLSEHCLKPCFFSVSNCLTATTNTCFPSTLRDERPGRRRAARRPRGRLERSFDFYDDWEEDENDALLEWEAEEADRLLGDDDSAAPQPPRRGIMNYGTGGTGAVIRAIGGTSAPAQRRPQRRNTGDQDPTVIPNQSLFGFLDRLPFKLGARGLRYKPSASGLQDRPPIAKDEERAAAAAAASSNPSGARARSATLDSHRTEDSLSSRGDIFPSDDEAEDAVAFDDEFAARFLPDDAAAAARRDRDRPRRLRRRPSADGHSSSGGASSAAPESRPDSAGGRSDASGPAGDGAVDALRREELRARDDEEAGVAARREAAARLARRRGLGDAEAPADAHADSGSLGGSSRSSGEGALSPSERAAET